MARLISKTKTNTFLRHSNSHRHRSSEAPKCKWVEIDGVKLLEEHFHRVMVKKATPDWLPFLPGSSFWVPPPFLHKFSVPSQPFLGSLFSLLSSLFSLSFSLSLSFTNKPFSICSVQKSSDAIFIPPRSQTQVTLQLKVITPLSEDDEG
ncbi:hypothetical protein VNO78_22946 [Psophocarpus tetragonolobus]|uniref:Uncharacterized protein n=1 Tax=Psophocarpus tetragonolobus TaxID=3891 RepID=A0AAN9XE04_PSOTE